MQKRNCITKVRSNRIQKNETEKEKAAKQQTTHLQTNQHTEKQLTGYKTEVKNLNQQIDELETEQK